MNLTSLIGSYVYIGGYAVPPSPTTVAISDAEYAADDILAAVINSAVAAGSVSATSTPVGFPREDVFTGESGGGVVDTDNQTASEVSVTDTDDNFTGDNVEEILAELFESIGVGGGGSGLFDAVAILRDQRSANTGGGSSTSTTWNTRPLQTELYDPTGIVSLSSNQFTLAAGTYLVSGYSVIGASGGGIHKTRIRNITDSTTDIDGNSEYSDNAQNGSYHGRSTVQGVLALASSKTFELQHYTQVGVATTGLGNPANQGVEVYGELIIIRISTPLERGVSGVFDAYAYLRDEKSSGTNAGTFTSGAWRTRVLNTEVADVDGIVSLSSNQFTLDAGTYLIKARAPAFVVDFHKLKLRNITDSSDAAVGAGAHCSSGASSVTHAFLTAEVTIAGTKTFELQHQCLSTRNNEGLGIATSFGVAEVYAEVEIWRKA